MTKDEVIRSQFIGKALSVVDLVDMKTWTPEKGIEQLRQYKLEFETAQAQESKDLAEACLSLTEDL